jgi:hypothetical protein
MDNTKLQKLIKKMVEGYYMPVYEPKTKNQYDNTPYDERRVIMTTIFYPENYAVYNYGELPTEIQTAVND